MNHVSHRGEPNTLLTFALSLGCTIATLGGAFAIFALQWPLA